MEGQCKFSHFLAQLNPFWWSKRLVRTTIGIFIVLALVLYACFIISPISDAGAAEYPTLTIDSINLNTTVVPVALKNHELEVPDRIAGAYSVTESKIFLLGHSSTVFKNLHKAKIGDQFTYTDQTYVITEIETLAKSKISMTSILAPADVPTIIIMTCAGDSLPNRDATHRLLVTATLLEN